MDSSRRTLIKALACSPVLLITGCDASSLLSLQPKDESTSEAVWSNKSLILSYINNVYAGVGWGYGDPMIAGGADEAMNNHGYGAIVKDCTMTPTSRGFWDYDDEVIDKFGWPQLYSHFRDLNIFLKKIEETDAVGPSLKEQLKGEAYFLRAFYYHNLVRLYGGVPLIEGVFELEGDLKQYQIPRNSFKETIDFIVQDLDRAAERLPLQAEQKGRATKGAALALKSRILLFAASDLFVRNPSGRPETGYTSGDQQSRWRAAKEAAQAVIDLGQYSLYDGEYVDIWINEDHEEIIWARYFTPAASETHNQGLWLSPNGYACYGGDCPLQQHVDKYEMADGTPFDWKNPEHAAHPYKNRDPRLHANIHYNGRDWRERPEGLQGADPKGVIQTGWYEMPGQKNMRPGLDTREGPIQTWNGTNTGYYLRKFINRSLNPLEEQQYNPWIFARYAEVLLNYAEASAELGETQDAVMALNQVRSRAGMPDVPPNGAPDRTLMECIRNERAVELAFEEFRYFDIRRWMIGEEAYKNGKGIRIEGRLDDDGELLVNHRYKYEYEVIEVDQRQWRDKAYFLPIRLAEIQSNPKLVQNPGYS